MKTEKTRLHPGLENTDTKPVYQKKSLLDWVILGVVVAIAGVVIALSFQNTATLAGELNLNPYLTAGLVELLFASLLFIRGHQRATQRNVPAFLSIGYFSSLAFITSVNMYGLHQENEIIGPIIGIAISGAMWLMESVLVWLFTESDRPHQKKMRELKREAQREIKEMKLRQKLEWMRWEAEKPDMGLIKEARREEQKRERITGEGLPAFFTEPRQGERPQLKLVPPPQPEPEKVKPPIRKVKKKKKKEQETLQLGLF